MDSFDDTALALTKYGVGQPVSRMEDPTLLRGRGSYTDDQNLPGQAYAVMVRSKHAHGILKGIDSTAAAAMPGVLAILTYADMEEAGFGPMKCGVNFPQRDGSPMKTPPRHSLAKDKVRYVGEVIACVIAETAVQAKDAAEIVEPDIEVLPAVTTPAQALAADAPQLHDEAPGNLLLDFHYGNAEAVAKAFAEAAHVTRLEIESNRIVVAPMEPRSAIGSVENGRWVLRVGCQGVMGLRGGMAKDVLNTTPDKVRILTGNVGGSFGMKSQAYPEYGPLLLAAKKLGRPVKWTDERSESFLSDNQGRDHQRIAELALDKDGRFLAVRLSGTANAGAYVFPPMPATGNAVKNLIDVYRTPVMEVNSLVAFTNTTPIAAYRGAGRPEANYFMERMIDTAAREMGIDRIELRRRNHIAPEQMPYKAPSGMNYDSGEFTTILDKAVKTSDWHGFDKRKAESARRGKLRGRGIGQYLEVTGPPSKEYGGIRFEEDGTITMLSGTLDYGQGHATPFAQVLGEQLGIPVSKFRLLQGDSDQLKVGGGTGGSKSALVGSQAFLEAGDKLIEQGKQIAAHVMEAAVVDIEFAHGRFAIAGTDRSVSILELADKLRNGLKLPPDIAQSLDVSHISDNPPFSFPNGCHVSEVEIDRETGTIEVVRYFMVNDFGTVINPMLVAGQAHGGVVQGIGQILMEHARYDEQGQPITGSFMDYAMPRATDAPGFAIENHSVPCKTNRLGVKGCGEAGCAGALPSVMNAIVDALSEVGITHIDMPVTPEKVWRVLNEKR
jgi:carbon-monoxide dehydrogenase large subunit